MSILDPNTIVYYLKGSYFPGATIDRTKFPAEKDTIVDRDSWSKNIGNVLTAKPLAPIGIAFTKKQFNPSNHQMNCTVGVKFYEDVSTPLKITIIQTESGHNYKQSKANWNPSILNPYFHEHVVRQMVPDHFGEQLTSGPTSNGTFVEHEFSFTSVDSVFAKRMPEHPSVRSSKPTPRVSSTASKASVPLNP
jgi:hypothetical protein